MLNRIRCIAMSMLLMVFATFALTTPTESSASALQGFGPNVFALSNFAEDNEVIYFRRGADGTMTNAGKIPTDGNGTGSPLDSQGALILNATNTRLYACNPGSDTIAVMALDGAFPVSFRS